MKKPKKRSFTRNTILNTVFKIANAIRFNSPLINARKKHNTKPMKTIHFRIVEVSTDTGLRYASQVKTIFGWRYKYNHKVFQDDKKNYDYLGYSKEAVKEGVVRAIYNNTRLKPSLVNIYEHPMIRKL